MKDHLVPTSINSPPLLPNRDISNDVIRLIEDRGDSKINFLKQLIDGIVKIGQDEILNINDSIVLWDLPCGFLRKSGDVIHLYERPNREKFWSLIAPDEWNNELIHLGTYRILYDYMMEKI